MEDVRFMGNSEIGRDKRKFERVEAKFIVTYQVLSPSEVRRQFWDREIGGVMVDISGGGMGIITAHEIPALAMLALKFTMFDPFSIDKKPVKIETKGEVRYNLPLGRGEHRLGIQFIEIIEEAKQIIKNFVEGNPFLG